MPEEIDDNVETVEETEEQSEETQNESEPTLEEAEESKETEEEAEESEEIPVRSTASYIIDRLKRKNEKLESKLEEVEESEPDSLEARLERIEQLALGQAEDKELVSLFEKYPEAKKYESKIKAYMGHEAYKAVSPEVIYRHVSYDDTRAEVSKKRKAADFEAEQTRSAGSSARDTRSRDEKTASEIKNMTDKEFREYEQEMQRRARS